MAGNILNFGSLNIDYVYTVDHIVREGETESSLDYQVFPGGKGLNQSVALARAGGGRAVFHGGSIGREGMFLKEILEKEGIDCTWLSVDEGANGHAIIQRSLAGNNSIVLYPGANHKNTKDRIRQVLSAFGRGDILVCQNEVSHVDFLIQEAYERGMRIAWNPSPVTDVIHQVDFSWLTWLIINEIEGECITGEGDPEKILEQLKRRYPELQVVLTLGEEGAVYAGNGLVIPQESFPVTVQDTTAAGDTFLGYFICAAAEAEGEEAIREALRMASRAAALAVSRQGAMPSIPWRSEVENG